MSTPIVIQRITPILNVSDIGASVVWFESLGWRRSFCWNDGGGIIANNQTENEHGPADFGGVCSGDVEIFLCKGAQGSRPGWISPEIRTDATEGAWMSWWVQSPAEVDALHAIAVKLDYNIPLSPRNEPWGVREFHLRHPDGHTMRVSSGVEAE